MAERPILFSGPMVRAILDGRKTVTRRIWKMPPGFRWYGELGGEREGSIACCKGGAVLDLEEVRSPYGRPGDRLWVRETWGVLHDRYVRDSDEPTWWRATDEDPTQVGPTRWRPSIHMPRNRSRITLEVTGVRVERLQEISENDSLAEGIDADMCRQSIGKAPLKGGYFPICAFSYLWDQINGAGSWDANPWVWVVEFERSLPKDQTA